MHSHHIGQHKRRHAKQEVSNGPPSVLNQYNRLVKKAPVPATISRTVYVTLEPTFTGSIAGYTTIGQSNDDDDETTTRRRTSTKTTQTKAKTTTSAKEEDDTSAKEDTTTASPSVRTSTSDSSSSSPLTTLATNTRGDAQFGSESSTTSALTSATSESNSDSSPSGSSAGAKAGIAFGVLIGVALVLLVVYFVIKKRKSKAEEGRQGLEDDERINGTFFEKRGSAQTTRTTPVAPRLSLRPVTQFLPGLDKRNSKSAATMNPAISSAPAAAAIVPAPPSPIRSPGQSPWERPMTSDSNHVENPFGNCAERVQTPIHDSTSTATTTPVSVHSSQSVQANLAPAPAPTSAPMPAADVPSSMDATGPAVAGTAVAASAIVAGAAAPHLERKASMKKDSPKALNLTQKPVLPMTGIPGSPANTDYSMSSASSQQGAGSSQSVTAIAVADGPNTFTVHRVQLDFVPTLEDEMELKAGQLVRLLHEYDDGWALCIRLDRSQQGVVPRTCLSARPVKPKPQQGVIRTGPPVNPNNQGPRGPGPQGYPRQPRPMPPAGLPLSHRPQSPVGRPMSPYHPQSPAGRPPQSPASGKPQRAINQPSQFPDSSGSPSGTMRHNSPPGSSPMSPNSPPRQIHQQSQPQGQSQQETERKPVPGQAY